MNRGTQWTPFTKQLVVVALLIGTALLLLRITNVIPPLIIALVFAYFVSVGIPWVQRNTGWSRGASAALTQFFILLLVLIVPAAITPWLVNAVTGFGSTLAKVITELLSATPKPIEITPNLVINLGPFYQPINAWLRSVVGPELGTLENLGGLPGLLPNITTGVTTVLRGAVSGIIYLFFILVVAFYTARDGPV
jgi:predicted PurR-regulated permease PerM